MGFLAAQYFFAHQPEGSPMAQICIMVRASWSCRDDTAFLDRPKEWLALKCAVKPRSLERHLLQLAKLELLVWNGSGFRLPRFYEFNRQIGGQVRQIVRQNVRQIGGAYKERMYGNVCEETPPLPSPPGRERKLTRRERKEQENLEALKISRARQRPHWPASMAPGRSTLRSTVSCAGVCRRAKTASVRPITNTTTRGSATSAWRRRGRSCGPRRSKRNGDSRFISWRRILGRKRQLAT